MKEKCVSASRVDTPLGALLVFHVFVVADSEVLEQEPEVAEPEAKLG